MSPHALPKLAADAGNDEGRRLMPTPFGEREAQASLIAITSC